MGVISMRKIAVTNDQGEVRFAQEDKLELAAKDGFKVVVEGANGERRNAQPSKLSMAMEDGFRPLDEKGYWLSESTKQAKETEKPKETSMLSSVIEAGKDAKRMFDQGILSGFTDELQAGSRALAEKFKGNDFTDAYDQFKAEERANIQQARERSPIASTIGEIAGGLAQPTPLGKEAGLLKTAGVLGAQGAVAAAGESEADLLRGGVKEFAKDVAFGGGIGAIAPLGIAGANEGTKMIGRKLGKVTEDFVPSYQDIMKLTPTEKAELATNPQALARFNSSIEAGLLPKEPAQVLDGVISKKGAPILSGDIAGSITNIKSKIVNLGEDLGGRVKNIDRFLNQVTDTSSISRSSPDIEIIPTMVTGDQLRFGVKKNGVEIPKAEFIVERVSDTGSPFGNTSLRVTSAKIPPEFQKQGIGTKAYEEIEKFTGETLKPHHNQSEAGKALWASKNRRFGENPPVLEQLDLIGDPFSKTRDELFGNLTGLQQRRASKILADYEDYYAKLLENNPTDRFAAFRQFKKKVQEDVKNYDKDPAMASAAKVVRELARNTSSIERSFMDRALETIKKKAPVSAELESGLKKSGDEYRKVLNDMTNLYDLEEMLGMVSAKQKAPVNLDRGPFKLGRDAVVYGLELFGLPGGSSFESQLKLRQLMDKWKPVESVTKGYGKFEGVLNNQQFQRALSRGLIRANVPEGERQEAVKQANDAKTEEDQDNYSNKR